MPKSCYRSFCCPSSHLDHKRCWECGFCKKCLHHPQCLIGRVSYMVNRQGLSEQTAKEICRLQDLARQRDLSLQERADLSEYVSTSYCPRRKSRSTSIHRLVWSRLHKISDDEPSGGSS